MTASRETTPTTASIAATGTSGASRPRRSRPTFDDFQANSCVRLAAITDGLSSSPPAASTLCSATAVCTSSRKRRRRARPWPRSPGNRQRGRGVDLGGFILNGNERTEGVSKWLRSFVLSIDSRRTFLVRGIQCVSLMELATRRPVPATARQQAEPRTVNRLSHAPSSPLHRASGTPTPCALRLSRLPSHPNAECVARISQSPGPLMLLGLSEVAGARVRGIPPRKDLPPHVTYEGL